VFSEYVLEHGVESPQDLFVTDHQVGLRAKRMEDTGQLDSDISGTDNGNPLRLLFDVEETVRVDTVRGSGDILILGDSRSTTDSNNEFLGSNSVLRAVWSLDLDLILVEERGISFVVGYIVLDQVLLAKREI
jgi:hypothetical protein